MIGHGRNSVVAVGGTIPGSASVICMETSVVRKRIMDALERGKREAAEQRVRKAQAAEHFQRFLETIAVPLCRQVADVVKAERQPFIVHTPSEAVRLSAERAPTDFVELYLDASGHTPQVMARISRVRGRETLSEERPVKAGAHVEHVSEEDVLELLAEAMPVLVGR
jgi:hypothetical protein